MGATYVKVVSLADDIRKCLLPGIAVHAPSGEDVALGEDLLNLLERAVRRLGEHEDDVDRGEHVENAEDEVRYEALGSGVSMGGSGEDGGRTMFARPGGTANASAVLNAQFDAVETDTALARTLKETEGQHYAGGERCGATYFMGKISAGYVHDVGPMVMAKLHTKKYENTMIALVMPSWPVISHTAAKTCRQPPLEGRYLKRCETLTVLRVRDTVPVPKASLQTANEEEPHPHE